MQSLSFAAPQRHESLTIFPLVSENGGGQAYMLLPDAIQTGAVEITELGSGTVRSLLATNSGDIDVLILDGEQLIGAKQNRTASRSIVLPAHSRTEIPVSCMEHGRWSGRSRTFGASRYYSPPQVRVAHRRVEALSAEEGMPALPELLAGAQQDVWHRVAQYGRTLGANSPTGALDEIAAVRSGDVSAWVKRFPAVPGQVGILAFVGDTPIGLDVIGQRDLYARMHARLVGAYALEALAADDAGNGLEPAAAEATLARVVTARRTKEPTVGRGVYRVLSGDVVGAELEDHAHLVHLSAFPREE